MSTTHLNYIRLCMWVNNVLLAKNLFIELKGKKTAKKNQFLTFHYQQSIIC